MNRLGEFWYYAPKVLALPARLRIIRDEGSQPVAPTPVHSASMLLGAVLRGTSLLQLHAETDCRGWQRLVRWPQPLSYDALGYVLERYPIAD
jgi:hypothetical protein